MSKRHEENVFCFCFVLIARDWFDRLTKMKEKGVSCHKTFVTCLTVLQLLYLKKRKKVELKLVASPFVKLHLLSYFQDTEVVAQ